jgi:signal transduction histidine kinase
VRHRAVADLRLAVEAGIRLAAGDRGYELTYGGRVTTDEATKDHRAPHGAAAATRTMQPFRILSGGGPKTLRGPFARWPRTADAVLAVAAFLATVFLVEGPGDSILIRPIDEFPILGSLVFAVACAALYWRRRAPLVVLGVALAAWVVMFPSDILHGWATMIALYSAGRYAANPWWGAAGAAVASVVVAVDGLRGPDNFWQVVVVGSVFMFGWWYVGRRLRLRQERAGQLVRERAAEARRIVVEERTRIARELHDVVAHRVSLMTVQAGGAKAVAGEDPAAALQAMGAVEEAGRAALDELRHLLGVLRPDTGDLDDLGPQPGLADLPRLVEQIRRAGVDVALTTQDLPAGLPARLDLFAYRIVQEALTNVLKHAGPGTSTEVRLRGGAGEIVIEVLDDGRGTTVVPDPDATEEAGGHGVVGMRERVLLLGGRLEAGPRPAGGFRVVAHLPIEGEPA